MTKEPHPKKTCFKICCQLRLRSLWASMQSKHSLYCASETLWTQHYDSISMQINAIYHGFMNCIFQMKTCDSFLIYGLNIDCGCLLEPPHRGDSNKHSQSIFLNKTKKNNVYPCKPHFSLYKVGFQRVLTA